MLRKAGARPDKLGEGPDELRRIVQGRHELEMCDPRLRRVIASLNVNFVQRFHVVRDKRNGNHQYASGACGCQVLEG